MSSLKIKQEMNMPIIGQYNNNECRILCINCVHPSVDYETRYPPLVFSYLKSMAEKAFPDIRFNQKNSSKLCFGVIIFGI